MIRVKNLAIKKNQNTILRNVSCELRAGEIVGFMGESGGGKTTLFSCIAQLECAYEGTIEYDGRNLNAFAPRDRARAIGFVMQSYELFPLLTVLENCIQPMIVVCLMNEDEARQRAMAMLEKLDLVEHKNKYPRELSGGQQQRAALARALCLEPQFLLLDEPSSALDPENTERVKTLLIDYVSQGKGIGIISHDELLMRKIATRIYCMQEGWLQELLV